MAMDTDWLIVKRYANRRLYDPTEGLYVSPETLKQVQAEGVRVVILDAETDEDVMDQVLAMRH